MDVPTIEKVLRKPLYQVFLFYVILEDNSIEYYGVYMCIYGALCLC